MMTEFGSAHHKPRGLEGGVLFKSGGDENRPDSKYF